MILGGGKANTGIGDAHLSRLFRHSHLSSRENKPFLGAFQQKTGRIPRNSIVDDFYTNIRPSRVLYWGPQRLGGTGTK